MVSRVLAALALGAAPVCAMAADAASSPGLGSLLQVSLGLGVVLAMVVGAAWLARRLGVTPGQSDGLVKVRGGAAVGQRERVVVVEVENTWLVLGVAPGRVSPLHAMARPEGAPRAPAAPVPHSFAQWLKRAVKDSHRA
ncbi:MAG TPA: flagellar biosynthetic protein FliO [Burkholderiales bacterium]|nr:flagellar biosynthetic protein FliO [Burkholderiales bacterium]